MCKNMTADGFSSIGTGKESTSSRVALNLVGHQDGNVELYEHVSLVSIA